MADNQANKSARKYYIYLSKVSGMKYYSLLIIVSLFHFSLPAQQLSKQDYERAAAFQMRNLTNKKVFNLLVNVTWFADSSGFSYITQKKNEKQFNKFEFSSQKSVPLFDQERLAKLLTDILKKSNYLCRFAHYRYPLY